MSFVGPGAGTLEERQALGSGMYTGTGFPNYAPRQTQQQAMSTLGGGSTTPTAGTSFQPNLMVNNHAGPGNTNYDMTGTPTVGQGGMGSAPQTSQQGMGLQPQFLQSLMGALFGGSPYGGFGGRSGMGGFGGSPFGGSPYGGSRFGGSPYGGSPYGGSRFGGSPYGGSQYGAYPPYGRQSFFGSPASMGGAFFGK